MIEFLKIIESLLTSLAIVIGGIWAYYKFIKGRLFKPKLELSIKSQIECYKTYKELLMDYKIVNVGLSKVNLSTCGIRIWKYISRADTLDIENVQWAKIGSFPAFEKHQWIEPGETINEMNLVALNDDKNSYYKSVLIINGENQTWESISITRINFNEDKYD